MSNFYIEPKDAYIFLYDHLLNFDCETDIERLEDGIIIRLIYKGRPKDAVFIPKNRNHGYIMIC